MKITLLSLLCLWASGSLLAQNKFVIHGKIALLSGSKTIIINSPSGNFSAPIAADGSFELSGTVTEPGGSLIKTDSSGADAIWLEPGEYTIACKEITLGGERNYLFRMPFLKGPKDAEISHGFDQPRYAIRGSSREETMALHKAFSTQYLDSILRYFPQSKTLPRMIQFSTYYIGDEAARHYQTMLNTEQKTDQYSNTLSNYLARKEKLTKEKLFEDFSMTTDQGALFRLSSLSEKKLILVDFWSSDCYPCRKKHEVLATLYEKYAAKGLAIVSVSLDDNRADWLKAIKQDKMSWINVAELKGWDTPLAVRYFVKSLPYSLWLKGDRTVIGPELAEKDILALLE